ncbi:hemolysin III family protein [Candidatus Saccharibacteria bacterium]|nr:hemolysin III family protein [Candidatus Saccharibacteria bacterium]
MSKVSIPKYTLGEEIFNSISHGIAAGLSVAALVLMVIKASTGMAEVAVSLFGAMMIILYTISCVYHALSRNLKGKKVLRVIDHCNVYLLVFATYIPVAWLGVGGALGWVMFGAVGAIVTVGVVFSAISVDKFQKLEVICHLTSGWASLLVLPVLLEHMGLGGVVFLILGGAMYSIGALLYMLGKNIKYMHSVFHLFCIAGTFFHFWCVYIYLL